MAADTQGVVGPGGTVGILGGGQLGRMLAMAAARLGLKTAIYAPEKDSPAFQVCDVHVIGSYGDHDALRAFANSVDVVTYEFENVPGDAASVLSALKSVRPCPKALTVIQDRLAEKTFARQAGILTTPFAAVDSEETLQQALKSVGVPSVLKTSRLGYDGKGQRMVRTPQDLRKAWDELHRVPCILEGFVNFTRELSLVAARGLDGTIACYDLVENQHENHILRTTLAPAKANARLKTEARRIAVEEGLNPELFLCLIRQESGFRSQIISPVGAIGLCQLMPGTARSLGVNPYQPLENLRGGARYLTGLLRKYRGNHRLALAAYNAGPMAVDCYQTGRSARVDGKTINPRKIMREIPPYSETVNYVASIERAWLGSGVQTPNQASFAGKTTKAPSPRAATPFVSHRSTSSAPPRASAAVTNKKKPSKTTTYYFRDFNPEEGA